MTYSLYTYIFVLIQNRSNSGFSASHFCVIFENLSNVDTA